MQRASLRVLISRRPYSSEAQSKEPISNDVSDASSIDFNKVLNPSERIFLKAYVNSLYDRNLLENIGNVSSVLSGSRIEFETHWTPSPLSSASLYTAFLRTFLIRMNEMPTKQFIKAALDLTSSKNSCWSASDNQEAKRKLYLDQINFLKKKREFLLLRNTYDKTAGRELDLIGVKIEKLERWLETMDLNASVTSNLHPQANGAGRRILGMSIEISGPKKGSRSMTWKESVGSTSISSDLVVFEQSKLQLPSKVGTYGLSATIVYSKTSDLVSKNLSLSSSFKSTKIFPFKLKAEKKVEFY